MAIESSANVIECGSIFRMNATNLCVNRMMFISPSRIFSHESQISVECGRKVVS